MSGAGALEVAVADALVKHKPNVKGRAQLGVQAFADALLIIPKVRDLFSTSKGFQCFFAFFLWSIKGTRTVSASVDYSFCIFLCRFWPRTLATTRRRPCWSCRWSTKSLVSWLESTSAQVRTTAHLLLEDWVTQYISRYSWLIWPVNNNAVFWGYIHIPFIQILHDMFWVNTIKTNI